MGGERECHGQISWPVSHCRATRVAATGPNDDRYAFQNFSRRRLVKDTTMMGVMSTVIGVLLEGTPSAQALGYVGACTCVHSSLCNNACVQFGCMYIHMYLFPLTLYWLWQLTEYMCYRFKKDLKKKRSIPSEEYSTTGMPFHNVF